jgi:hypothetical protein
MMTIDWGDRPFTDTPGYFFPNDLILDKWHQMGNGTDYIKSGYGGPHDVPRATCTRDKIKEIWMFLLKKANIDPESVEKVHHAGVKFIVAFDKTGNFTWIEPVAIIQLRNHAAPFCFITCTGGNIMNFPSVHLLVQRLIYDNHNKSGFIKESFPP